MIRFSHWIRGLLVVAAIAAASLPMAAQAGGGGKGFCGTYGGGGCHQTSFCFPTNHCYQPCYTPPVCYRPVVAPCHPVFVQPCIQPWMFNHQPTMHQFQGRQFPGR